MLHTETYKRALRSARDHLGDITPRNSESRSIALEAAYWYLHNTYSGQWSSEYKEFCWAQRHVTLGANARGPQGLAEQVYTQLIYSELTEEVL